jgi:hypothetical protein
MRGTQEADETIDNSSGPPPARGTILTLAHRYKIVIILIVLIVALTLATGGTFRGKVRSPSNGITPQSGRTAASSTAHV